MQQQVPTALQGGDDYGLTHAQRAALDARVYLRFAGPDTNLLVPRERPAGAPPADVRALVVYVLTQQRLNRAPTDTGGPTQPAPEPQANEPATAPTYHVLVDTGAEPRLPQGDSRIPLALAMHLGTLQYADDFVLPAINEAAAPRDE
jgi:hypothetical protein